MDPLLEHTLNDIIESAVAVLPQSFDRVNDLAAMYDLHEGSIRMIAKYNHCEETANLTYEPSEGLVSQTFVTHQPVIENDLAQNPLVKYLNKGEYARRSINCALLIPLIYEKEVHGVLELTSAKRRFSQKDVSALQPVTRLASRALAQMHEARAAQQIPAHLSHELRTPLTCVAGYSHLLKRKLEKGNYTPAQVEEMEEFLLRINKGVDRALQVMEYAKVIGLIERGTLVPEKHVVELGDLVREQVELFGSSAKRVELHQERYAGSCVSVDEHLVGQAITKVLENSVDFARTHVHVRIGEEDIQGKMTGVVSVFNDGETIAQHQRSRLFQRNYTGKKNGTGYGLWHARQLMRLNDGDLVNVPIMGGARFDFYLPLVK